ncbi:MAG: FtsW/RodA/SpoVE family cell cycle protein [Armatimonadota bacterium]
MSSPRLAAPAVPTAPATVPPVLPTSRPSLLATRRTLLWLPLVLCLIGLIFLTSVSIGDIKLSAPPRSPLEPFRSVLQQACWVLLGIGVMLALAWIPVRFYQASARFWLVLFSLVLIALWLVPGLGVERNGAVRWIELPLPLLGQISMQPSEVFKLATLLFFAALYSKPGASWRKGDYLLVALWATALLAVERQPDFGTMVLLFMLGVGVAFLGGARLSSIALLMVIAVLGAAVLIGLPALRGGVSADGEVGYRLKRILAMLDPWGNEHDIGYQIVRAQIAVGSGGLARLAIGEGREKRYLPAAENDYIFVTIAEETGFVGCLVCIGLFAWLVGACFVLATRAPTRFGRLFAGGLGLWIGLQALLNMGMAIGLLPPVGLPLPFVSEGGSATVSLMAALGIAQAIAREAR